MPSKGDNEILALPLLPSQLPMRSQVSSITHPSPIVCFLPTGTKTKGSSKHGPKLTKLTQMLSPKDTSPPPFSFVKEKTGPLFNKRVLWVTGWRTVMNIWSWQEKVCHQAGVL